MDSERIKSEFIKYFRREPNLFVAPGRINLIGEHVDYNDGLVMPAATDKHFTFAIAPSGTDKCNIYATDFEEGVSFVVTDLNPGETWINYLMGVIDAFQRNGAAIGGIDCVFGGTIPPGAGMSSSAALCCGFGYALNEIFDLRFDRLQLAKMAQYSEHEFVGLNCGLMDQYASLNGKENSVLLMDCRSLTHETLSFEFPGHSLLLIDTKVKHSLAGSGYNDRRASCEEGVKILRKKYPEVISLRDVSRVMLYDMQDKLGEEVFIRCLFVVEEIARTQSAATCIRNGDLAGFGELMYLSHWGLSQAYEVSCEELDSLVMMAEEMKSDAIGARMMGGGFGGCTINLVRKSKEGIFKEMVKERYWESFKREPEFYPVSLSRGVHRL